MAIQCLLEQNGSQLVRTDELGTLRMKPRAADGLILCTVLEIFDYNTRLVVSLKTLLSLIEPNCLQIFRLQSRHHNVDVVISQSYRTSMGIPPVAGR